MAFHSIDELIKLSKRENKEIWEIVAKTDSSERGVSFDETYETMRHMYLAMREADDSYDESLRSASGLAGGDGAKLEAFRKQENRLIGDFLTEVMAKAVKMGESNACMRRIVAAPTAGACGVIPAVMLTYAEQKNISEDKMVEALFVAGGIGEIIAENASIAGAEGGCQAEIGTAAAMAAGALTYLEGGDHEMIGSAVALSLKNMMGLTCDPVAGLVEVPCIKRNVFGAVNAVIASQMVMAGVKSHIPADEVIDAVRRVGKLLPPCLRETGQDGLATTQTGLKVTKELRK